MRVASVSIVGTGVRTPAGLTTRSAAAALHAGISAVQEHPFLVDQVGEPIRGALDAELDVRSTGPSRLVDLLLPALQEACLPLGRAGGTPVRLSLFLALPELRPGFTEEDASFVRQGLLACTSLPVALAGVHVFHRGHAAGALSLAAAVAHLGQHEGDACLLAGVESYFHPDTMEWLDAHRQLAGSVSRSGFFPGEGAGACLVMTRAACEQRGLEALLQVRAVATRRETKLSKGEDVCLGEGLSEAVGEAIGDLQIPGPSISGIVCDLNGERYRGEEWGFVCLRLGHRFDDPTAYLSPAECWGDLGAASVPVFAALACEAAQRGYARGPRTLVWASSEGGDRGAVVLECGRKAQRAGGFP